MTEQELLTSVLPQVDDFRAWLIDTVVVNNYNEAQYKTLLEMIGIETENGPDYQEIFED